MPWVAAGLMGLIAPERCLGCRSRMAAPWCDRCWTVIERAAPVCQRCAATGRPGHPCWPLDTPVNATVAAFDYAGPTVAAIRTAKLGGAWAGWSALGCAVADAAVDVAVDIDVVTWIATVADRVRQRGFDHAQMLATVVGTRLALPVMPMLNVVVRGHTETFEVADGLQLPSSNVLLVDDVLTTGATAAKAASALTVAGAGSVTLAVVARAGRHELVGAR